MGTMSTSVWDGLMLPNVALHHALLFDVACALSIHAIYHHCEPNASLILVHFLLLIAVPTIPASLFAPHFHGLELAVLSAFTLFYFSLVASIVIYRLSPFHPLAEYPGPLLAKISKFWTMIVMARGKHHIRIKQLHEKYGSYIRIGPNEISVLDASAIPDVLGPDGMPKGPMWSSRAPNPKMPPMIAIRSHHEHARRRKPWNRAFSTASTKDYEPIVQKRTLQLVSELEKRSTKAGVQSVNLSQWIGYFTTDFAGEMAFGGGFELMRDGGDKEGIWTVIDDSMHIASLFMHIPWFTALLRKLPFALEADGKMNNFAINRVRLRKANGALRKDLFYHLIDEDKYEKEPLSDAEVASDGILAIIAGSDTAATVLSGLFYYLLAQPQDYKRLQEEIDASFPPGQGNAFDATKLAEMPFLNAVINEALRLHPAVPTYLQRAPAAGSGGQMVGDRFVPEGTAVIVPAYALSRSPAYFYPSPESFWPDRWILRSAVNRADGFDQNATESNTKDEVITNTDAFIPFSSGPANCVGRPIAIVALRMVVASLIQHFELKFAPGYNPKEWEERLEDRFVVSNGPLPVQLTPRV